MKNPKIRSTVNYDQFRIMEGNREISKSHLKNLRNSIKAKNLLYLFPIVVNIHREVIDGQHRLMAARELGLPIYYLIDSHVTKADIAMVNNTRKGWTAKDYINFYVKDGRKPYKNLSWLMKTYPITVVGGTRLMSKDVMTYSAGGGTTSVNVRAGKINDGDFEIAKTVCAITWELYQYVPYAFRPDMLLELKSVVVKHKLKKNECVEKLKSKKYLFQKESGYGDTSPKIMRGILIPESKGHTAEDVERILKSKNII